MLSRTMSVIQLFGRGATPIGALLGGSLATLASPRAALTVLLAGLTIPAVLVLLTPLRRVHTLTELPVLAFDSRMSALDQGVEPAGRSRIAHAAE